ncbi:UDP-galactopyranose mutase [Streptococcus pneumoniae]|nr:UDP-galactopyranose mutase [Streptococcus pneumoniae]
MITGELKNKIDQLWEILWTEGNANPLTNIEQLTYLLFMKDLDTVELGRESDAEFNNYINSPLANYKGSLYNLPFNMNTFYAMWGTKTPQEVKDKIAEQTAHMKDVEPKNLEE